jgi:hypothetical protein
LKISPGSVPLIAVPYTRQHSGFHVYVGGRILPEDETGLEKLAKYIIRACFSQERMIYIPVEKNHGWRGHGYIHI